MITKVCKKCDIEKEISLFCKAKDCVNGVNGTCKECFNKRYRDKYQNDEAHRSHRVERQRKCFYKLDNYKKSILRNIKRRCLKDNIPFNIDLNDLHIPDLCPVLNIPLIIGQRRKRHEKHFNNNPSVDRIIPELGYVKGNVKIISYRANWLKNNASISEVKAIYNYMIKEINPVGEQNGI